MKSRLSEAALTAVEFAFAREQTFAQEPLGHLKPSTLDEVAAVGDQNIAYEVGMVYEVDCARTQVESNYVAARARCLRQKGGRIATELAQASHYGFPLQGRWL
jgi:hypothetical protein